MYIYISKMHTFLLFQAGVAGVANYFQIQLKDVFNNTITTDPKVPINVTLISIYGTTKVSHTLK